LGAKSKTKNLEYSRWGTWQNKDFSKMFTTEDAIKINGYASLINFKGYMYVFGNTIHFRLSSYWSTADNKDAATRKQQRIFLEDIEQNLDLDAFKTITINEDR
jgi:hypothetical protein